MFRSRKNKLVNTLATAQMNDLQTAVYKATAADQLPPKEKHVLFVLRAAATPSQQAEASLYLAKRLQACRSAKTTVVAAKALVLVHRLAVAGHTEVLHEAIRELPQVCGEPEARHEVAMAPGFSTCIGGVGRPIGTRALLSQVSAATVGAGASIARSRGAAKRAIFERPT